MALLMGLIFSFHIQYQQPPSFYLKSPTLLWVFTLIALRALNFQARYVVTAGIVAAAGLAAAGALRDEDRPARLDGDARLRRVPHVEQRAARRRDRQDPRHPDVHRRARAREQAHRTGWSRMPRVETASNEELARFVPSEVAQRARTSDASLSAGEGETDGGDGAVPRHRGLHHDLRAHAAGGRRRHAQRLLRRGSRSRSSAARA